MSPRWFTAAALNALADHNLRLRQMQIAEAEFHSTVATVSALYDASRRTPAIQTYKHLMASRARSVTR